MIELRYPHTWHADSTGVSRSTKRSCFWLSNSPTLTLLQSRIVAPPSCFGWGGVESMSAIDCWEMDGWRDEDLGDGGWGAPRRLPMLAREVRLEYGGRSAISVNKFIICTVQLGRDRLLKLSCLIRGECVVERRLRVWTTRYVGNCLSPLLHVFFWWFLGRTTLLLKLLLLLLPLFFFFYRVCFLLLPLPFLEATDVGGEAWAWSGDVPTVNLHHISCYRALRYMLDYKSLPMKYLSN